MTTDALFQKLESGIEPDRDDLYSMLSLEREEDRKRLFRLAYAVKEKFVGKKVFFRGLIEISNICSKNCYYCGIRRDNTKVHRYKMTEDEIVRAAAWAAEADFGSIVLQSGERSDRAFTDGVERTLLAIRREVGNQLGITLALGEQTEETYRRWFESGAHRYLLRIEASNRELYAHLHPADHSYDARLECIRILQQIGYQTGTGVMIGLPGQTIWNLVDDLEFFKSMDIDMIGMGPYLVHPDTPLAGEFPDFDSKKEFQLNLGLKMIATARIFLKNVNIASTTALQALQHDGRELGLLAGANIIMPNITDSRYREDYQLYTGKPGVKDGPADTLGPLRREIESIGESIGFGERGDPKHFFSRRNSNR